MSTPYGNERVEEWLQANLPSWEVADDAIHRTYETGSWRLTLMVANAIGFLAESVDHHPKLVLNYPRVDVYLSTHSADGITQKDFELATRIEETMTWLPAEDAALDGPAGSWLQWTGRRKGEKSSRTLE